MNDIFSSRDFEANVERSKKFKVEIDSEEKNPWDGKEDGVGRSFGFRVRSASKRTIKSTM